MALKVELKPGERIIIGNAVLRNGEARARFTIERQTVVLRERDILTAQTAASPAKRIYLLVQLMYLDGDTARHHEVYFELIQDFLRAAPSSSQHIADINTEILGGDLYKALRAARRLVDYEAEILAHAPGC